MTQNKSAMTIIGGTRGLGRWMAEHLGNDFEITITSRDEASGRKVASEMNVGYNNDNIAAVKDADIILFCVPIEHMVDTIAQVAPHAPEGSLLMDVASVKTEPAEALEKYAPENVEILPCHPMFGPRVPTLKRQIIILTPIKNKSGQWFGRVENYLKKTECEVVITTPSEHDKYMSIVQGLTHFSYISLASAIRKLNINVKRSRSFSSPVYTIMLDMASRVVFQNPHLYYSIQKNNKETSNARKTLIKECIYLSNLIEEGDEEDFVKSIVESANHIDEYEDALIRSDMAIGMLTQKANVLTKRMGEEVGLQHNVSKKVHVGVVRYVDSKFATLESPDGSQIKLKLSKLDILSDEELFEWKRNNLKLEHFTLRVLLASTCDEKCLLEMFKNIEQVIDAEIIDVCDGGQIDESLSSFTFRYSVFDGSDKSYVEDYIRGIGGVIRD
ncbi:prephenate dehydrogenase [uncultured Methanobrevibacter sp.]|uniref:prephenate dehydrogenase n=1 Tax=uncultured Methanobrevibacter sp. TaxID=253161 RepID=UPI00260B6EED|nr:prephenate dehydrogenase [uncultured Methanobrevibacter sp.]